MIKSPGKKPVLSIDDIQEHAVQLRMLRGDENQTWNGVIYFLNTFAVERDSINAVESRKRHDRLQAYAGMVKNMFQLDLL